MDWFLCKIDRHGLKTLSTSRQYWLPNSEVWITSCVIKDLYQCKILLVILMKSDLHISLAGYRFHWLPVSWGISLLNSPLRSLCFTSQYFSKKVMNVTLTCRSQPADSRKKRALSSSTSVTAMNPLTASSRSAILMCHAMEGSDRKQGKLVPLFGSKVLEWIFLFSTPFLFVASILMLPFFIYLFFI